MGVTRSGINARMFRNGEELVVGASVGGLYDPDACNVEDLRIGCRFSEDGDWYQGRMWNLRVLNRELSDDDIKFIFLTERHLFGV